MIKTSFFDYKHTVRNFKILDKIQEITTKNYVAV
jgi:hypothetical protein